MQYSRVSQDSSGQFTGLLAPHFSRVVATDVSEAQVEQARTKLAGLDNVELAVGSGEMIQVRLLLMSL